MIQNKDISFLREPQVAILTGLSKSTRWRLEKKGAFPKRRQLSANAVGWLMHEVQTWLQSREMADKK